MKRNLVIFLGILLLCFQCTFLLGFNTFYQKARLRKVIIDAGHGGHDGGAEGRYSKEKDISLAVALKLGKLVEDEIPDIEVVFTRTQDIYQSPVTKANIANLNKGDLFISIHCNSAAPVRHSEVTGHTTQVYYTGKGRKKKKHTRKVAKYRYWTTPNVAQGTETYIWGAHKTDMKEKAMGENEALYLDSATANFVKDFDPNSPDRMILYSLKTQQYFNRSANLALTVEDEFKKVGRISRQAQQRQVGIWVLQAVAMPSILVETGFISNPTEEDYLNSDNGQNEIVRCVVQAIKRYKYSLQNQSSSVTSNN
ncbi:N-acetylmuramoyl-L-alanine amidase family protein [Segetibacter koreensis]|uniref:N-acetylmuramoyl-L-alanine amidase family protein n=1 Tax=Segetibacter koreensis TaxID=398037 RepID=UPI00036D44F6|nr:N-acetylmuramoyl-L-alanine amidase [Segetibacter koreensis]